MDTALQSIAGAVVGKELTPQEIETLKRELQTNKDVRQTVKEITDSLQRSPQVKYCPVDGQRFSATLKECPIHHMELKELDEE